MLCRGFGLLLSLSIRVMRVFGWEGGVMKMIFVVVHSMVLCIFWR